MLSLWLDASIIFAVVILNSLLGSLQEGQAEKAFDSIRSMLSAEARVLRGGEVRLIPAEELAPGDIVLLESGDKIPADLRLVEARNLRTEEAALTGESVPAENSTSTVPAKATVGDRENMAFSGTTVVSGRVIGIVVATGSQTELGHCQDAWHRSRQDGRGGLRDRDHERCRAAGLRAGGGCVRPCQPRA